MKILAINGSYRKNGNTVRMIKLVAAQMGEIATKKGMAYYESSAKEGKGIQSIFT